MRTALALGLGLVACTQAEPRVDAMPEPAPTLAHAREQPGRCEVGAPRDMPGRRMSLRAWARVPGREHDAYLPLHALRHEVALFGEHVELEVELEYTNPWAEPITLVQPLVSLGWEHVDHVVHVGERAHRDRVVSADEAQLLHASPGIEVRPRLDTTMLVRGVDEVGPGETIRVELAFARRLAVLEPGQDAATPDWTNAAAPREPVTTRTALLSLPRVGGCVETLELAITVEQSEVLPPLATSSHTLTQGTRGGSTLLELHEGGPQPADVELSWPLARREPAYRSSHTNPRALELLAAIERMHALGPWPRRGSCFPAPGQVEHDVELALALGIATPQTCTIAWVEEAGLRSHESMQPRCDADARREPLASTLWAELEPLGVLDPRPSKRERARRDEAKR
jgi:hypothetical protein